MSDAADRHYGRGAFLLLLGGGLSSLAWGTKVSGVLSPLTSAFSQLVGNIFPVGGWRIYTISGSMPIFDPKTWRLEIGGLVKKPRSFTYDELLALPRAHQVNDFHCVTGWTVRNVRWSGVRFSHLLDQVEPLPQAKAIRFVSLEQPYNDSLSLGQAAPARRDARARDGRQAAHRARTARRRASSSPRCTATRASSG